jgi:D-alanyl-lipoteichoic acid acyltransferase DltB (MBOAT superfamily)
MLFNSVEFLIFLPVVYLLYLVIPYKRSALLLLVASYFFYASWKYEYLLLIIFTTFSSYLFGIKVENSSNRFIRRVYLSLALIINFGVLFVFKYFNFFNSVLADLFSLFSLTYEETALKLLLPVGISFYTFQALSYVIDIYRSKVKAERNLVKFSLFVSFFPQLVAGPIERSDRLIPQLGGLKVFKYENISDGFKMILWGLFTKIVIADRLALCVNHVYNDVYSFSGISLLIATFFFTYQIYLDFSGYSNIAIGVAKLFNVDLMQNFRNPYFSKSITEFWSRWHISLSTWFRDYLYIPLGGNMVSKPRWIFNLFFVFIISGFWHGANYTFIIWGAIHGLMLIIEKIYYGDRLKKLYADGLYVNLIRTVATYLVVVIAWVFFRANSFSDAIYIIGHIFDINYSDLLAIKYSGGTSKMFGVATYDFILSFVFILILVIISYITKKEGIVVVIKRQSVFLRWFIYILTVFTILWFGKFGLNQFIYFQF